MTVPRSNRLSRRAVVSGLGALAATGCGPGVELKGPFPLGVASGDATESALVVWTRYEGVAKELTVVVWREGETDAGARREPAGVVNGACSFDLTGLAAATWYRYRFESGVAGEVSPEGRARTAFAPDALAPLVLGASCCIKYNHSYGALSHAAGRTDLDAFVFLGDSVYTDGSSSLGDFRTAWARGLVKPEYTALRGSTSMITQWDDHEVRNNWDGDSVDPVLLANARQAFLEHQPLRLDAGPTGRLWRRLSWGRTVDAWVLDSRSERNRAQGHYLSPEQLTWLTDGIANSQAVFKLVLNTVPIGSFDSAFFAPFNGDNWQAFPAQRTQLLQAIADSDARGVIFMSGDFHFGCVGQVAPHGPGSKLLETLVGPGAQAPNPSPSYPYNAQWPFSTGINNYVTFGFDPSARTVAIQYVASAGRVLFDRTYSADDLGGA